MVRKAWGKSLFEREKRFYMLEMQSRQPKNHQK